MPPAPGKALLSATATMNASSGTPGHWVVRRYPEARSNGSAEPYAYR